MTISKSKLLTAAAMSTLLIQAAALPAHAATTPVQGTTMTFDKYLVMKEQANVPNATFNFTIEPISSADVIVAGNESELSIRQGIGTPSITSASFSPSSSTSSTLLSDDEDKLTLASGEKYAKDSVTVDFSQITFNEPGVYRYQITEASSNEPGITNDTNATRYLDVYVENDGNGGLQIQGYLMHTNNDAIIKGENPEGKPDSFVNTYTTYDLTLSKTLSGNQAYYDQYFAFTIQIDNADPQVTYNLSGLDQTVTIDGESKENPATITADASGQAQATVYLKHGDALIINGMTAQTQYTISEAAKDYSASYQIDEGDAISSDTTETNTIQDDTLVAFTNTREGTIPTGLILNNGPSIALMSIAIAGSIILLIATRRKNIED